MTAIALTLALIAGPPHDGCQTHKCVLRVENKRKRRIVRPYSRKLDRIAACESGGRWRLFSGNGYSGGLQFVLSTWWSLGGTGYPHQHSKLEQKYRAVLLYKRNGSWVGTAGWPVCGYR